MRRCVFLRYGMLLFLLAAAGIILLSSCGSKEDKKSETLRVGMDFNHQPMGYINAKGQKVGFDVDLAIELGKVMEVEIELVSSKWKNMLVALKADRFDCAISSASITEEREKDFIFTKPYINNSQIIVVKPFNNEIKSTKDFLDKKIGCKLNTGAYYFCMEIKKNIPFELKEYEKVLEPFIDMKSGDLDAIVVDEIVARYFVNSDPESYKLAEEKFISEPIGVMFKKDNVELMKRVDKSLDELRKNGNLKKISEKWFGVDLTSEIN